MAQGCLRWQQLHWQANNETGVQRYVTLQLSFLPTATTNYPHLGQATEMQHLCKPQFVNWQQRKYLQRKHTNQTTTKRSSYLKYTQTKLKKPTKLNNQLIALVMAQTPPPLATVTD
jgi:hypothetical protein